MMILSRFRKWLAGKLLGDASGSVAAWHGPFDSGHVHLNVHGGQVVHLHERHGREWVVFYDLPNDALVCREAGSLSRREAARTAAQAYATVRPDLTRRNGGWMSP